MQKKYTIFEEEKKLRVALDFIWYAKQSVVVVKFPSVDVDVGCRCTSG